MTEQRKLLLPGEPGFYEILARTPPPDWRAAADRDGNTYAYVCEPGSGLLRAVGSVELEEYLAGGEWDERLDEWDELEEGDFWYEDEPDELD